LNILILDTTTYSPAFAYYIGGKQVISVIAENERNADTVVMLMKNEFSGHGISMKDIGIVSLSNGPGSYTGLRVGSAIAKGICTASGARLVEISTLDILAETSAGDVSAVIPSNSRTLEFYYADYSPENGRMKRQSKYMIDVIENINKRGKIIVIDKAENISFPAGMQVFHTDGKMKIDAQLRITMDKISKGEFADVSKSEPFYMKDFVPLKSKKNKLI
jgi:tRNA threonylcarbamoyladenosine biosynthesis protein TsaB